MSSSGGSLIDWLQSAPKIRRCAKFFHKVLGILIKDPPRIGSFRSNTKDSSNTPNSTTRIAIYSPRPVRR